MKEILILNRKEQNRAMVLSQIEGKRLTVEKAAILMKVSQRQAWRLVADYRREGIGGVAHGNRGRKPVNAFPEELKEEIVHLAVSKYEGFNHSHFTEKLVESEGIQVSRCYVRGLLLEKGLRSPRKRRSSRHRSRRQRYPGEGMLLQTDGSPHHWLEERGPSLCLIGAIDDATNKVPCALFREQETTEGYMRMLQGIISTHGVPLAIYHDRNAIFEVSQNFVPSVEEQLSGEESRTQFGRLLNELGIESISANSPQAKGRIERLWGTFQDRLTSELRLAGARTIDQANRVLTEFLPEYNRKFAVVARDPQTAYLKVPKSFRAEEYFCLKHSRTVGADNVVRFMGKRLQVLPSSARSSYARCKVEVHERFDGSLAIYHQGKPLDIQPAPAEATLMRRSASPPASTELVMSLGKPSLITSHKPAADHPWRGKFRVCIK
jgi:transposase